MTMHQSIDPRSFLLFYALTKVFPPHGYLYLNVNHFARKSPNFLIKKFKSGHVSSPKGAFVTSFGILIRPDYRSQFRTRFNDCLHG